MKKKFKLNEVKKMLYQGHGIQNTNDCDVWTVLLDDEGHFWRFDSNDIKNSYYRLEAEEVFPFTDVFVNFLTNEERDIEYKDIDSVQKMLPYEEQLASLAEECTELAQAALKLRRAWNGENPTPKSEEECRANLIEEVCDVMNCFYVLGVPFCKNPEKFKRWVKRLKKRDEDK